MNRTALAVLSAGLLTLEMAGPVLAAPPSNDTFAGRTSVGALPFVTSVDTTEATTDADDQEWNAQCGAPSTDASVWFELSLVDDAIILIDSAGSDYSAGITVVTGSPGTLTTITCGPGSVAFEAFGGETYQVVVFDDQEDGSGNGGTLALSIDLAPPPPTVDVTVDSAARFSNATNSVTLTGTVTCEGAADFAFIDITLEQRAGRAIIRGFGGAEFTCDGTTQAWSSEVFGDNGLFKGGKATASVFATACSFACGEDFEQVSVKLRGG